MKTFNEKAILINVKISLWTARKYDRKATSEIEATHHTNNAGRFNKLLIESETLKDIQKISGQIRNFIYDKTLTWDDNGTRILPSENYLPFVSELGKLKEKFSYLSKEFVKEYDKARENSKIRLNGLFNEKDYPPAIEVENKFNILVSAQPVPTTNNFYLDMEKEAVEDIKKEMEDSFENKKRNTTSEIIERIKSVLNAAYFKLSEKASIFRDSLIYNIEELTNLVPSFNIMLDDEIECINEKIINTVLIYEPDELRKDEGKRKEIANSINKILKQIK